VPSLVLPGLRELRVSRAVEPLHALGQGVADEQQLHWRSCYHIVWCCQTDVGTRGGDMSDHATTQAVDDLLSTAGEWASPPPPEVAAVLGNLLQLYAVYTDRGREAELATLFTPDARWDGTELGFGVGEGPEAIAATVLSHFNPAKPMMHVPGPPLLVAVSDDIVRGISWCIATRMSGDRLDPLIWFQYHDEFRRDDGAWRFRSRQLLLRFRA
jgi:SnoaL-like domain